MKRVSLFLCMVLGLALGLTTLADAQQSGGGVVNIQRVEALKVVQSRHENRIMTIPGVVGFGIGLTEDGNDLAFVVYVVKLTSEIKAQVPARIEGVPVRLLESGEIRAY